MRKKHVQFISLCALIIFASLFNITRSVHIDDPVYIETGRSILHDPAHPLSGTMNWTEVAEPLHAFNQPILLPALLSSCMMITGQSVPALHLLMVLFASISILFFFRIASRLTGYPLICTILFAAGPAFINGQNLMTDLPCITFWLIFFDALTSRYRTRYLVAAVAASLGCMTKYVSLALLPALLFVIAFDRSWRTLWVLALPCMTLAAWSLYNLLDFGGMHLFRMSEAKSTPLDILQKSLDWFYGLGAFIPAALISLPVFITRRKKTVTLVTVMLFAGIAVSRSLILYETVPQAILSTTFMLSGALLGVTLAVVLANDLKTYLQTRAIDRNRLIVWLWIFAGGSFIILFSPFMASRHVLLVLPAIILLLAQTIFPHLPQRLIVTGVILTVALGTMLGIADWQWAKTYQAAIPAIKAKTAGGGKVWFSGHWGWQWYAANAGMHQYDTTGPAPAVGDYFVLPRNVVRQTLRPRDCASLKHIDSVVAPFSIFTLLRPAQQVHGMYYFSILNFPYAISTEPIEVFSIFRYDPGQGDSYAQESGLCKTYVRRPIRYIRK